MKKSIRERLFELRDEKYRLFQCRLMPNVAEESVIGVRTPLLRKLAAELAGTDEAKAFLCELPHKYYDENNLHAFLIQKIKDYGECVRATDAFLPYVDNWATCDSMSPRVFAKHTAELEPQIRLWLDSGRLYTVRFAIRLLMNLYLGDAFKKEYLDWVCAADSEEYYQSMMVAWFFATALAKRYDEALPYIGQCRLSVATHNRTLQKALESYRISDERKQYLRSLKIKG